MSLFALLLLSFFLSFFLLLLSLVLLYCLQVRPCKCICFCITWRQQQQSQEPAQSDIGRPTNNQKKTNRQKLVEESQSLSRISRKSTSSLCFSPTFALSSLFIRFHFSPKRTDKFHSVFIFIPGEPLVMHLEPKHIFLLRNQLNVLRRSIPSQQNRRPRRAHASVSEFGSDSKKRFEKKNV